MCLRVRVFTCRREHVHVCLSARVYTRGRRLIAFENFDITGLPYIQFAHAQTEVLNRGDQYPYQLHFLTNVYHRSCCNQR